MQASLMRDHALTSCELEEDYCTAGCGVKVIRKDMSKHLQNECKKQFESVSSFVSCKWNCGLLFSHQTNPKNRILLAEMKENHEEKECPLRRIPCKYKGCQRKIKAYEAEMHHRQCERRVVPCGHNSRSCARMLKSWVKDETLVLCDDHHSSALMWAMSQNEVHVIRQLLECVHDSLGKRDTYVDCQDCLRDTALAKACRRGHLDSLKTFVHLLSRKVDENAHSGDRDIEKSVMFFDVNQIIGTGSTALIEAIRMEQPQVVRYLVEEVRAVLSVKYYGKGWSLDAIDWARKLKRSEILRCVMGPLMSRSFDYQH